MLRFNQYDQIVHAALAGHGIALGRLALIAPMLADRRLAAVGGQPASATEHAYWLVRNARRSTPDADVVTRWLTEQAAATARGLGTDYPGGPRGQIYTELYKDRPRLR